MRIAIAGLHNEASAFSLHRAETDFFRYHRGDGLLANYDFVAPLTADGVEFVPVLVAMGGASGFVLPAVYDAIESEVVAGLEAAVAEAPLDGVYLHMHGAVAVEGRGAAEEAFVGAVRRVVGPDTLIAVSMDPHGNFSREYAELVDLASVHRHSPHIDNFQTPGRVVGDLVEALRRGERPAKAWVRIPVLLPGERTSTVVEPGATVFGAVEPAIERHGVLDAGLWVGFAWADEPRNAAAAFVTAWDPDAARACAEELAAGYWDARDGFVIVSEHSGSYADALDFLLTDAAVAPLFISDSGDNVTAGSAGDITYCLAETLARADVREAGKRVLVTGIHDPAAVAAAVEAGAGAVLDRAIGAGLDDRYAAPVPGPWHVVSIIDGVQGEGVVGAMLERDGVSVTVQTTRQRFVGANDPSATHNGAPNAALVDVTPFDAVVVKNGYLFPSQVAQSGSAFMALTPGGTDLDFERLEFSRRATPLHPWERDVDADLTAVVWGVR